MRGDLAIITYSQKIVVKKRETSSNKDTQRQLSICREGLGIHLSKWPQMTDVQMVYRSRQLGCGISLFTKRLGVELSRRGIFVRDCNFPSQSLIPGLNTIIHYVPSMWAGDEGALAVLLSKVKSKNVIAVLHGMYGPHEETYLKETLCPELAFHVSVLSTSAQTIIALSQSCNDAWHLWDIDDFGTKVEVFSHPGASRSDWNDLPKESYIFLGGINRPKKDIQGERLRNLLHDYYQRGVKVWVHISNPSQQYFHLPVWRLTTGILSDDRWFDALARAEAVLCPYETRLQCVSGIISESLSLGTRVISTDFPFAREMKRLYSDLVHIEDDLLKWGTFTPGETTHLVGSQIPTWGEFADMIASKLI
ncbi:MAG: hypothetical protein KKC76_03425 [Proteobacteria bacterium]|nr:hypothetical protein [Pseudomonadota bacterium]MBU4297465.1 hypothetical protein [Pseudomonadota bacterium]MCG2746448.1 hypothetical protein [Desulfobulbaceae bacterium]